MRVDRITKDDVTPDIRRAARVVTNKNPYPCNGRDKFGCDKHVWARWAYCGVCKHKFSYKPERTAQ